MLPRSAVSHYRQQQAITVAAARRAGMLWATIGDEFDAGWNAIADQMFEVTAAAQLAAAASGLQYVPAVLAEQGIEAPASVSVNPQRFMGGTRDGRPLESLLPGAVYEAKSQVAAGKPTSLALLAGRTWLEDVVMDAIRDANRQAVAGGLTARPAVQGWVRMLNPPSCKFCVMLAGKFFRWNQGFQSHLRCDCRHIPSNESLAGDLTVDPYAYFGSLSPREQDRIFGKADAQAIRDGADMYRVINIRTRGLADDALKNTTGRNRGWQARRWDTPSKMTIDDIYAAAKSRDEAIEMMADNGFITGTQTAGGNLRGNSASGYAGQAGRGGTRVGATRAYQEAIRTGVRDPLDPATQTAAERRLMDAVLAQRAVNQGRNPFGSTALTAADRELVERVYLREIAKLADGPEQVRDVARALGIDDDIVRGVKPATTAAAGGAGIPPRAPRAGSADWPDDLPPMPDRAWRHVLETHHTPEPLPGKTQFPADWSETTIASAIQAVLREHTVVPKGSIQFWDGTYQGVDIRVHVIIKRRGVEVSTAYPRTRPQE